MLFLLLLCGIAIIYTISFRIDLFSWGSSQSDGLFIIVIPIWILPITYVILILKWYLEKKSGKKIKYENLVLITLFTVVGFWVLFDSQLMYYFSMMLSVSIIVWLINSLILRFFRV